MSETIQFRRKPSKRVEVAYDEEDSKAASASSAEPAGWREAWDAIAVMRGPGGVAHNAPVDTIGCSSLADTGPATPPEVSRFQTLVALMLSSQTKDAATAEAMRRLKADLPGGLTVQSVLAAPEAQINELIRNVGFHNRKAGYLKRTAEILQAEYSGDIPPTLEGLMSLPGVGPKMAHLAMLAAWKQVVGIGVDVHVHRIADRLGWTKGARTPEDSRKMLEAWLPRERWPLINKLLVGFGQTYCKAKNPGCGACLAREWCAYGRKVLRGRKPVGELAADRNATTGAGAEGEEEEEEAASDIDDAGSTKAASKRSGSRKATAASAGGKGRKRKKQQAEEEDSSASEQEEGEGEKATTAARTSSRPARKRKR